MTDDLTLEMTTDQAAYFAELADHSPKTLQEVHDAFREMLAEVVEHPFRSQLTRQLEELLTGLELLPQVDCEALPEFARGTVKGWLIQNGVMVGFIKGYYDVMSADA